MADPFLGEIRLFSFGFAPRGWALCNGQLLPINQNQALFSLLGTTYGGDGKTTFALPDLRTRVPVHVGNGIVRGQKAGELTHTLTIGELPAHMHLAMGSTAEGSLPSPVGNVWAQVTDYPLYYATANGTMNAAALATVGKSQAHSNVQPSLVLNFCIAISGIFPSHN